MEIGEILGLLGGILTAGAGMAKWLFTRADRIRKEEQAREDARAADVLAREKERRKEQAEWHAKELALKERELTLVEERIDALKDNTKATREATNVSFRAIEFDENGDPIDTRKLKEQIDQARAESVSDKSLKDTLVDADDD